MTDASDDALADSPVLEGLGGHPSKVSRRDNPLALWLGVAGLACVAVLVFSSLSRDRSAHAQANRSTPSAAVAAPSAAPLAVLNPPINNAAVIAPAPQPSILPIDPDPESGAANKAPAMIIDISDEGPSAAASVASAAPVQGPDRGAAAGRSAPSDGQGVDARLSADERFAERISGASAPVVRATRLRNTALIAPQGTVIPAVLETAINLDLPGYTRAVVTRDVRGFDGSTVLIPRGSHLIGQYRAGATSGISRAFIVWSRVLTPDGVSVEIGSPGADELGQAGLSGETNSHFFKRFGGSILLSVLNAGLDALVPGSAYSPSIVIGSPQQATNIAAIALQKQIDIPDTVTVKQGAVIRVFVARDLDFSAVAARSQ